MAQERIDILDQNGNKTGISKTKKEAHAKGLWHQAVHVWMYNSKGEILLQKRSIKKDSWPGMWDISAAGHVSSGETPEKAAVREIREEIGVKANSADLKQILFRKSSTRPKEGYYNNEFDYVYLYRLDETPKDLQKGEVEYVVFIPLEKLESDLKIPIIAKNYVPHSYYPELIKILKKGINYKIKLFLLLLDQFYREQSEAIIQ